jgi:hypothetical protein
MTLFAGEDAKMVVADLAKDNGEEDTTLAVKLRFKKERAKLRRVVT